ncbi:MAG: helix-turn-helix transcriptional regulator [Chitinispirillaceae bacterium]|nr:helix-turn-helix transcriptional regulator [Chitinispirillaceae bacterium]
MGYYISCMATKTSPFGKRLAAVRKARGLSQRDLAQKVGISYRMIAYYEAQTSRPPAEKLTVLANALKVSTDELLGHVSMSVHEPANSRLWKRLQVVEQLPPQAQKQVVELIELLAKNQAATNNTKR